jgi:hypothetical protein
VTPTVPVSIHGDPHLLADPSLWRRINRSLSWLSPLEENLTDHLDEVINRISFVNAADRTPLQVLERLVNFYFGSAPECAVRLELTTLGEAHPLWLDRRLETLWDEISGLPQLILFWVLPVPVPLPKVCRTAEPDGPVTETAHWLQEAIAERVCRRAPSRFNLFLLETHGE